MQTAGKDTGFNRAFHALGILLLGFGFMASPLLAEDGSLAPERNALREITFGQSRVDVFNTMVSHGQFIQEGEFMVREIEKSTDIDTSDARRWAKFMTRGLEKNGEQPAFYLRTRESDYLIMFEFCENKLCRYYVRGRKWRRVEFHSNLIPEWDFLVRLMREEYGPPQNQRPVVKAQLRDGYTTWFKVWSPGSRRVSLGISKTEDVWMDDQRNVTRMPFHSAVLRIESLPQVSKQPMDGKNVLARSPFKGWTP